MTFRTTRTVILLRKDVAPQHWYRSWTELVADAEGGVDGVQLAEQPLHGESGVPLHEWTEGPKEEPVRKQVAPPGWAAFYQTDLRPYPFLHFQNY